MVKRMLAAMDGNERRRHWRYQFYYFIFFLVKFELEICASLTCQQQYEYNLIGQQQRQTVFGVRVRTGNSYLTNASTHIIHLL